MKRCISEKEKLVLDRISGVIRRKLRRLVQTRDPLKKTDLPVTLMELMHYLMGKKEVPAFKLVKLLEFYGCSQATIAEWNMKISVMIFRALKKARGEEIPRPDLDL